MHEVVMCARAGLLLIFAMALLVGCSVLPAPPPANLGITHLAREALAEPCKVTFTEQRLTDGMLSYTGADPRGVYTIDFVGTDDVLMRVTFTVTPEQEPTMWRPNYVDRCLVRLLAHIGQGWAHPWYYEHIDQGEAVEDVAGVRATLTGGGAENLVLEMTALDFTEQITGAEAEPGAPTAETDCGPRVVAGLGGQRLNLRAQPGTDAAIVVKLAEGAEVRHLCATQVEGGRTWANVAAQAEGKPVRGWVSEEFLRQP